MVYGTKSTALGNSRKEVQQCFLFKAFKPATLQNVLLHRPQEVFCFSDHQSRLYLVNGILFHVLLLAIPPQRGPVN